MFSFSVDQLITTFGYLGIFLLIFAETGALVGFFLPGDTLLISAGIFAAKGNLNLGLLFLIVLVASVMGNTVGYYLGKVYGKRLFLREDATFFKKSHLERAKKFYDKHGGKTIVIARFIAGIRALAPLVAGMSDMPEKHFFTYTFVGGLFWAIILPLFGFYLGKTIPDVTQYILPTVLIIFFFSLLPGVYHFVKYTFSKKK